MKKIIKAIYESAVFSIIITLFLTEIVSGVVITIIEAVAMNNLPQTDFWKFCIFYGSFLGYWIVFLLAMIIVKRNRPFLKKLGRNSGNTVKLTLIGAVLGFVTNGVSVLVASLYGQIFLSLNNHTSVIELIILFFLVMIQSGAEELFSRVFLYQRIKLKYPSEIPSVLITAGLFAAVHLANPGINILAVIDLFLSGLVFGAIIYYFDAFWACVTYHTLWNYTQSIIFGLPNSGLVSLYSLFKLDASADAISFAYNPEFGVEGTALSIIVLLITFVGIVLAGEKKKKKERQAVSQETKEIADESVTNLDY